MMRLETFNTIAALNAAAANAASAEKIGNKRVYYCQRCLNHNRLEPRKNHKCDCLYATCTCNKCILVEKRRVLNTQLHELEEVFDGENEGDSDEQMAGARIKGERVPNCQKCGQHGRKSRLKGHKRVCPYRDCSCAKCQVVSERQKLMADQIKIRRRQRKDTLMNFTRKKITDTLNAAAVVAAATPIPYLNSFNALFYKQLQQNIQPSTGILSCCSPTGSTAPESASYSPTNSINYFTPSPTEAHKSAVNGQIQNPVPQLPLLFPSSATVALPTPTVAAAVSNAVGLPAPTVAAAVSSASSAPQIAMPIAINPLLAGCSTSGTILTDTLCKSSASAVKPGALSTNLSSTVDAKNNIVQSFFANIRLLEQKLCAGNGMPRDDTSSTYVDVCSM